MSTTQIAPGERVLLRAAGGRPVVAELIATGEGFVEVLADNGLKTTRISPTAAFVYRESLAKDLEQAFAGGEESELERLWKIAEKTS